MKESIEWQGLRYFIISYFYGKGSFGSGTMGYASDKFPSFEELKEISKVESLTILNILEVAKTDYVNFWNKEYVKNEYK